MTVVKVLRHGQITLPKNFREVLDIKEGDILEIELEQSCLVLKAKMLVDKDKPMSQGAQEPVLPVLRPGGRHGLPMPGATAGQGRGRHD
jgi:AbrB family looped-hinge helix DNA binding protein